TCYPGLSLERGKAYSIPRPSGHLVTSLQLASGWVSSYPIEGSSHDREGGDNLADFRIPLCALGGARGYYGVGHDRWHREFYSKLNRNDGKGTCCDLMDCRPTQSRMVGDHYEVKVDGEWTPVPNDRINN